MTDTRTPTAVDAIADRYFDASLALSPIALTDVGSTERQDEYDDLSPAGVDAQAALVERTLTELDSVEPADDVDRVTIAAMRERLGLAREVHEAGYDLATINGIASELHAVRAVYDMMPTDTPEQWATIARRLLAVPDALDGWFESVFAQLDREIRPAKRQVRLLAEQAESWVSDGNFFDGLRDGARIDGAPLPEDLQQQLAGSVDIAKRAFAEAARRLRSEVEPRSSDEDAVGRDRYRLESRRFLGAQIDLEETYAWGLAEVATIERLMQETAEQIKPGATIKEAVAVLDADPKYQLHGADELKRWMQGKADAAIENLNGDVFDIPEPVRRIECCIAPTNDGGIYYTAPSEDFSRPGRMWWSVPEGVEQFGTWRELTTVYHEGAPGHHLQLGQAVYRADLLNKWRRMGCWVSGHGEGWALYAEWLMSDFGYLDDPGDRLGLLDGQMLRAVRVVLDIGVHCGFPAPEVVGGGEWTYDKAWEYFNHYVNMDEGFGRFEVNRYFGWPGQAPAYKLGEKLWLELRDEVKRREGDAFDLKAFHARALDLGSVGLDVLRAAVLQEL